MERKAAPSSTLQFQSKQNREPTPQRDTRETTPGGSVSTQRPLMPSTLRPLAPSQIRK